MPNPSTLDDPTAGSPARAAGSAMVAGGLFSAEQLPYSPGPSRAASAGHGKVSAGGIGDVALALGVGSKGDKTDENEAFAAMHALRMSAIPSDRLVPMPPDVHPDWSAERIELVRVMSERFVAATSDVSTANLWRLNLIRPRPSYAMSDEALVRVVAGAENRASVAAGLVPAFRYRDAPAHEIPAPSTAQEGPAGRSGALAGKRRRRAQLDVNALSLGARMKGSWTVISIRWANPNTLPPFGLPRTIWEIAVPTDSESIAFADAWAPEVVLGSGWAYCVSIHKPDGPRWSEEAKGRVRRGNLSKRLAKQVPLFADQFYAEQLAQRPAYFAGKPYEVAPAQTKAAVPADDHEGTEATLLGHNGGPPLDP